MKTKCVSSILKDFHVRSREKNVGWQPSKEYFSGKSELKKKEIKTKKKKVAERGRRFEENDNWQLLKQSRR